MSNERTALVIVAGLAIAFAIAISERLKSPLRTIPASDPSSDTGYLVYLIGLAGLIGAYVLSRRYGSREIRLSHLVTWGAIFAILALFLHRFVS